MTCTATPFDGTEAGEPVDASVTIGNTPPTIGAVTLSPESAVVGDTLYCAYSGFSDVDGDADETTLSWTVDGVDAGTGDSLESGFVGGQVVTCTATPFDGTETGEPVEASVTISNSAPAMGGVVIDSDGPIQVGATLSCDPSASDVDGDELVFVYSWTSDGEFLSSDPILVITADIARPESEIGCLVTVSDGVATDTGYSSVVMLNSVPISEEISLSPAETVTVASSLICSATFSDADGDTLDLRYVWTNGSGVIGSDSDTLDLSEVGASKGDLILCTVTAEDPFGGTGEASVEAEVLNSQPEAVSGAITPSSPQTADALTLLATTTDADGDEVSLTIEWLVDGFVTGETGSSLSDSSIFHRGDSVSARVTPHDGTEAGESLLVGPVIIQNTPPAAPVVAISPSDPTADEDLVCEVTTPSVDADDDEITYTFAWMVDGEPADIVGSTVTAADTLSGDEWSCVAIPNDGEDDGVSSEPVIVNVTSACGSATDAQWYCGDDIRAEGSAAIKSGSTWVPTSLSIGGGSSAYAPSCSDNAIRFTSGTCGCFNPGAADGGNQGIGSMVEKVTLPTSQLSCDGRYSFTVVGTHHTSYQLMTHIFVWFDSTYVRASRWVWNRAGEAGVDVGTNGYTNRFSWSITNYPGQWFQMTLDIDTEADTCTASYVSSSHSQSHSFSCSVPSDVVPVVEVAGGTHGSHETDVSVLGLHSNTGF